MGDNIIFIVYYKLIFKSNKEVESHMNIEKGKSFYNSDNIQNVVNTKQDAQDYVINYHEDKGGHMMIDLEDYLQLPKYSEIKDVLAAVGTSKLEIIRVDEK